MNRDFINYGIYFLWCITIIVSVFPSIKQIVLNNTISFISKIIHVFSLAVSFLALILFSLVFIFPLNLGNVWVGICFPLGLLTMISTLAAAFIMINYFNGRMKQPYAACGILLFSASFLSFGHVLSHLVTT